MNEEYNKRRMKANELLLNAMKKVDPNKDNTGIYGDIAQLYRELNLDIKNEMEAIQNVKELELEKLKIDEEAKARQQQIEADRIKNETEKLKIETEAKTKAEAIKAERERTAEEAKTEKRKSILDIVGKVAMAVATIFTGITQIWMFKQSTKKEEDEALLTQTSQTVVRNGLSGRIFK